MIARLIAFLSCLLAGGLLGWAFGREPGVGFGIVAGAVAWFVVESLRAARVLRWLKEGGTGLVPSVGGLWGEAVDRSRRIMGARTRELEDAQRRLEEFLGAIQTSPDGVVLLDARGRIEWCNQTAVDQFG